MLTGDTKFFQHFGWVNHIFFLITYFFKNLVAMIKVLYSSNNTSFKSICAVASYW